MPVGEHVFVIPATPSQVTPSSRGVVHIAPGWRYVAVGNTDADLLAGLILNGIDFIAADLVSFGSGNITYNFDDADEVIQTDIGTFSFDSLPAGVVLREATINFGIVSCEWPNDGGAGTYSATLTFSWGFTTPAVIVLGPSSPLPPDGLITAQSIDFPVDPGITTFQDIILATIGWANVFTNSNNIITPNPAFIQTLLGNGFTINGTFDIIDYQFTLDTPTPIDPSVTNPITITDSPEEALLNTVTEVIINYIDEDGTPVEIIILPPFIVATPTLLTFLLPVLPGSPITYTVSIVGTGFSGIVLLGTLATIFFNGGSGIYRLVVGQKFDTCYINPTEPESALGDSVDVNIPDPFGKTGFIGG